MDCAWYRGRHGIRGHQHDRGWTVSVVYVYWLGLWLVGPFTSMASCDEARQWQLTWGTQAEVTECWVIIDSRDRVAGKE